MKTEKKAGSIERIAIIAKMANGKYHQILTCEKDMQQTLHFIARLTKSGKVELIETELEGVEF